MRRYSRCVPDSPSEIDALARRGLPPGLKGVGIFLFFGAAMSGFAGTTLLWRGTILDRAWRLNPAAYRQLVPLGPIVGILFLALAATMLLAGIGWFRRRFWGWGLAVAIIATQVLGDLINLIRGDFLRGGVGFAIAGALLFYLLRPAVRARFVVRTRREQL